MAGDVRHGPQGSHDSGTVDKCPFCDCVALRQGLLAVSNPRVAFYDAQPLNPGHVLIVPYRHEPDFLALLPDDRNATLRLAAELRSQLDEQYRPDGFNLDANVDKAGGQTVGHTHLHVIPRNWGDVSDPRGGIRCLIPERSRNWEADERGNQP